MTPTPHRSPGLTERLPIIQYWHEEAVPDYIAEMLATFREHNPSLRHVLFSEASAEEFIDEHFGAREVAAFRACAVPAMQADYLRYCAVLALGGIYVDVDERCVSSLTSLLPSDADGRLFIRPEGAVINGFFAFAAPGHALLELALEIASTNIERRRCEEVYFTTGPPIFTCLYWLDRLGSFDAVYERATGSGFVEHFRAYAETIESPDRASRALQGVRVSPIEDRVAFVRSAGPDLPYKHTDAHWTNAGPEIFRRP